MRCVRTYGSREGKETSVQESKKRGRWTRKAVAGKSMRAGVGGGGKRRKRVWWALGERKDGAAGLAGLAGQARQALRHELHTHINTCCQQITCLHTSRRVSIRSTAAAFLAAACSIACIAFTKVRWCGEGEHRREMSKSEAATRSCLFLSFQSRFCSMSGREKKETKAQPRKQILRPKLARGGRM